MEDRLKIVIKPEDTLDIGMQEQEPLQLRLGNAVIPTGTTNYNELGNKPKINGVTLQGSKSLSDLGIQDALDGKVNKSGDTMTGYLQLPRAQFQDGDYPRITFLDSSTSTVVGSIINHNAQRRTLVRQVSNNGSEETFQFPSSSSATSSAYYDVITSKGGTMIDDLNILYGHHFGAISPSIDITTTPAAYQGQDGLVIADKNYNTVGFVNCYQKTSGNVGLQIVAGRPINGSYVSNGMALEVAPDGTLGVGVSAPMQWRKALNGQDIKVRSGTTVITPSANSTSETVITSAQLATMFGISGSSPSNTTVMMSNGDYVANAVGVSSIYNSNVVGWKALFSEPISIPIRINWIAVYYGI